MNKILKNTIGVKITLTAAVHEKYFLLLVHEKILMVYKVQCMRNNYNSNIQTRHKNVFVT